MTSLRGHLTWACTLIGCLVAVYFLWPRAATTPLERQAVAEGRTVITYWDRHSGHEYEARAALINEFNESQDEVYVRSVPVGYNALMEKTLTSIAGSAPPDILSIDSAMLAQLAFQGLFTSLDDFVADIPCLQEGAFMPHVWKMIHFGGHLWAAGTTTDTYCLIWNKAAFRRAGLDPERPPKTLGEIEEYAAKLTVRNASGAIEQMGFLPWLPWDRTYMWGVMFGGTWYDEAQGRMVAAGDPHIRASLEWQQSFTVDPNAQEQLPYAMRPDRIAAFSKGIGEYFSANNPFYSGKVAMISEGEWQVTFIPKYAPGLDWGVAPLPQPEGVAPLGYGETCVADAIPITARHPEAAKKFLRWFYAPRPDGRPSPASDYCYAIHNIPCRTAEALQERFIRNPKFKVFVDQLTTRPVTPLPVTPIMQFIMDQTERLREWVTFRKITPEEAAQRIDDLCNRALERAWDQINRSRI